MKILYVENDQKWFELVTQCLSSQSYTVETVRTGWEASERLSRNQYDVVILDRNLPGISGVELCKRFRTSGGVAPVLMTADTYLVGEREEAIDSGADDYLLKPFESQELSTRIQALLKKASSKSRQGMPAVEDKLIGSTIADRYEVISELGRGGMGTVYLVKHAALDRLYAMKILQAQQLSDPINSKRFEREAKAASALSHPNLVSVYDFGFTALKLPFLVMDYLQGSTLDVVLKKEGVVSGVRYVTIFSQICDALSHVHSKGIVHRDLKPSNIMLVSNDGQPETVKIVDFGIAKLVSQGGSVETLTRPGEFFGSPYYISPEQTQPVEMDGRSDIYSLGCIMYEAATGVRPFEGTTVLHTVLKHLSDSPRALSAVRPDLNLPADLERIIFKAIAKNPDDRYQTTDHLKKDLQKLG